MLLPTAWFRGSPAWMRTIWREVAAFGIVGAFAFVVETASFNLLAFGPPGAGLLRATPVTASAIATLLAMLVSWVGNRHWTFRNRKGPIAAGEVAWFIGVNLIGLAITAAPVYAAHHLFGLSTALSDNVARLAGWAVATVVRFRVYRGRVFTPHRAEPSEVHALSRRRTGAGRDDRAWAGCLALMAAFCGYVVSTVFHPGFLTADSVEQLLQAQGTRPVTDWHPPVMALLWRILIHTTGALSALAALQAALLWGALWLLAVSVWKRTGSRPLSLLMLGIGLAPHIANFTGVVWKDVHMAYALLAVCALALFARELPTGHGRARCAVLTLGLLFMAYAILVRKNGFPAVLPLLPMLVIALWPRPGRRRWLIAAASLLAFSIVGGVAVSSATDPLAVRQYAQIPLDDVTHVLTPQEVRSAAEQAGATSSFANHLGVTAENCRRKRILWDAYFTCYPHNRGYRDKIGPHFTSREADVLVKMWLQQMPHQASGYLKYRARTFARLLFEGNLRYVSGTFPGTPKNVRVDPSLDAVMRSYVTGFAHDLSWLFQAWFWLAVALVLTLRRRWPGPWSREVRLLGLSSVLYIACYLPTAPQANYRYVYWPALAGTFALTLIAAGAVTRRRSLGTTEHHEAAPDWVAVDGSPPPSASPGASPAAKWPVKREATTSTVEGAQPPATLQHGDDAGC
ncbi:GtrA family protein [Streptomyces sp. NPDC005227]|uniref:GtrA family protein n=1 Tax=Streptomyces sp. NPDC005227 TaxID=3364707 RepID=UPI00368B36EA